MSGLLSLPQAVQSEIKTSLGLDELHDHAGITGLAYLRKVDARNYHRYFALPADISWPMIKSVSVAGLASFRQPTRAELACEWLYCYDRNSSHPYAASQIKAGIGQPVLAEDVAFDHLVPGFWSADIEGLEDLWQGLPLLPIHRDWLPTPLLKMAAYKGCKIKVHEAYIWPDKKDRAPVFARWANNLWGFRQQYEKGTPENDAYKGIMNKSVGLLRRKNGEGHVDYRPDWYSLILGEERAVVWYKAHEVFEELGAEPVGAYHDALYYCRDKEITKLTTLKNGNPSKDSLGGYKIEWKLPMVKEVQDILKIKRISAADRIGLLKAWGREHGYIK